MTVINWHRFSGINSITLITGRGLVVEDLSGSCFPATEILHEKSSAKNPPNKCGPLQLQVMTNHPLLHRKYFLENFLIPFKIVRTSASDGIFGRLLEKLRLLVVTT